MSPPEHLTDEGLLDLLRGEIGITIEPTPGDGENLTAERDHLLTCSSCAERAKEWRALLWSLALSSPDPDPARVAEIWHEAKRRAGLDPTSPPQTPADRFGAKLGATFRQLTASLRAESLQPSLAVRGSSVAAPRLLIFETDELAVSLSIATGPGAGRVRIVGGITPKTSRDLPRDGRVALFAGEQVIQASVTEQGEFTLEGILGGDLHLDITLGTDRIEISPIHIGGNAAGLGRTDRSE